MSIAMMNLVWKAAPYRAEKLLVLLAMADWSNEKGICWPSYKGIADRSRTTKSGAIRIVNQLIDDGAIKLYAKGGGKGHENYYQLLPNNWQRVTEGHRFNKAKGDPEATQRVTLDPSKGDPEDAVSLYMNHHGSIMGIHHVSANGTGSNITTTKSPLKNNFSITPEMEAWATERVPLVPILEATEKFKRNARTNGRVCADWVSAWETWMLKAEEFRQQRPSKGQDRWDALDAWAKEGSNGQEKPVN